MVSHHVNHVVLEMEALFVKPALPPMASARLVLLEMAWILLLVRVPPAFQGLSGQTELRFAKIVPWVLVERHAMSAVHLLESVFNVQQETDSIP